MARSKSGSRSGSKSKSGGRSSARAAAAAPAAAEVVEEAPGMGVDGGILVMTTLLLVTAILFLDFVLGVSGEGAFFK